MEEIPLRVSLLSGGKRVRLVAGDLEDDIPLPEELDRERQPAPNQIDHMHDQVLLLSLSLYVCMYVCNRYLI